MQHRVRLGVACIGFSLLASGGSVHAAPQDAQSSYADCRSYAKLEQYDSAIASCNAAYLASNDPAILYTLGQIYRLKGDSTQSIRFYEEFLHDSGANLSEEGRKGVEALIAAERTPSGGPPVEPAPSSRPNLAPASAANASRSVPQADSAVVGAAEPQAAERAPFYRDALGDAFVGAGAATLGGAAIALAVSNSDVTMAEGASHATYWQSAHDDAVTARTVAIAAAFGGGALVAAGVLRWWLRPRKEESATSSAVDVSVSASSFVISGTF